MININSLRMFITQPFLDDKLLKLFLCTNKAGKKNVTKEGKINLTTFFQTLQNKFNVIHFQDFDK